MSGLSGNPDALLFGLLAGILLIYVECNRPGLVLPGCAGGLLVLLTLHGLGGLALQPLGLMLVVCGLLSVAAEIIFGTRGVLACVGCCLLGFGLLSIITPSAAQHVHAVTAVIFSAGFSAVSVWLGRVALRARRNKRSYSAGEASAGRTG